MSLTVVQILGIILLVPYVFAPAVIWFTFRQRAYATFGVMEPHHLPAATRAYFVELTPDLAREGFVVTAYLSNAGSVAGVTAYLAVWTHPARGHLASTYIVLPSFGRATKVLEFETITALGAEDVMTSNLGSNAGVYNEVPARHKAQLPWVTSTSELYQVHLNRERRLLRPDAARYLPDPANVVEQVEAGTVVELREQVRTGLLRETSTPGEFRPTVAGAFVMVYRLLPPLKQIRLWQAKRRARVDHAEAMARPAPRPQRVNVTNVSPYMPPATQHPLGYS